MILKFYKYLIKKKLIIHLVILKNFKKINFFFNKKRIKINLNEVHRN